MRRCSSTLLLLSAALVVLIATGRLSAEEIDYLAEVKPILLARCVACHGPLKQSGGLRLDTVALAIKGGENGPAISANRDAKSLLVERISAKEESERMPPEGEPLSAEQIALVERWISEGAKAPPETPLANPQEHWAFQKVVRPPFPAGQLETASNPIDRFLGQRHTELGLQPLPEADRATLLRRVYIDLTGVPPQREELLAFLADERPDAYERVVERLLASPLHAQRWAKHWMDVWRYSDWYGSRDLNELRNSRRHIWRWRDWIIDSLAADKGYDQMILEMLAADELSPRDQQSQHALGYLGRNYYVFNRHVWLQDTVEHTAVGFLGLTFKCARCHDHKYDPISQEDYFRLRAFFEPHNVRTDSLPGKSELLKGNLPTGAVPGALLKEGTDIVYDADLAVPTFLLLRGNEKAPATDRPLSPGLPLVLRKNELKIEQIALPIESYYPELGEPARRERLAAAAAAIANAEDALKKATVQVEATRLVALTDELIAILQQQQFEVELAKNAIRISNAELQSLEARVVAEFARLNKESSRDETQSLARAASRAERTLALVRAEAETIAATRECELAQRTARPDDAPSQLKLHAAEEKLKGAQAAVDTARANLLKDDDTYQPLGPIYPAVSTGRRLALARWIVDRENPLASRVAVNHIWKRHFGSALVPSVANFGLNGKSPTHPELLDWLAVEFMERGWSQRHLHRLIVTSQAYRRSSGATALHETFAANESLDAENKLYWRANARRMESEVVRDSVLALTDSLDCSPSGPELEPALADVLPRRSLYFRITPDDQATMLQVFDGAAPAECYERMESIVPQQALALANSPVAVRQSRLLAGELSQSHAEQNAFVRAAFEQVLTRLPDETEQQQCAEFLDRQSVLLASPQSLKRKTIGTAASVAPSPDPKQRARENLVHVLINHNDFVTVR